MPSNAFSSRAQGTIEYLVIVGIVVVIALVVVGLMTGLIGGSSSEVSANSEKSTLYTQSIGLTESLVDPTDGNFAVKLLNNSGSTLTISNVQIGDKNVNFSEDLVQGNARVFQLQVGDVCEQGKVVTKDVVVTYISENGVVHKEKYPVKVMFDCTPYTITQANLANQCPVCTTYTFDGTATADKVASGFTFFGNSSTKLTGTYPVPVFDGTATADKVASGYTFFSDSDTKLTGTYPVPVFDGTATADKVLSGYSFFSDSSTRQDGSLNFCNGSATAANVLSGNTFCSDNSQLTGTMPTQTVSASTPHMLAGYYAATDLNTVDTDLAPANIKSGVNVLGVVGTAASATAKYVNLGTGQTGCWDNGGSAISCAGTGQDGAAYGAGYIHTWTTTTNTMLDVNTGLRWQKATNGSLTTWQSALSYCTGLTLDGYTGWRLPTVIEILGMWNYNTNLCFTGFTCGNKYWSGTTSSFASWRNQAYILNTENNTYTHAILMHDTKQYPNAYARCVRFEN